MTADSTTALTLQIRGPEDLLAAVPIVLGFEPEDSLVMMTVAGVRALHARADLPPGDQQAAEAALEALLGAARRNGVATVAFALYTPDPVHARRVGRRIVDAFLGARIRVVDCLRVHDGRWWVAFGRRTGVPGWGVPFDATSHPFRAQAVLEGLVTLGSRDELVAGLAPDVAAIAEVEAALGAAAELGESQLDAVIDAGLAEGRVSATDQLAALLVSLRKARLRDRAWTRIVPGRGADHVRLWTWVLRRTPGIHAADVGAILAFAAWRQGQGALAWCALDRCLEANPDHSLGRLVASVLEQALPPSAVPLDPTDFEDFVVPALPVVPDERSAHP